jgi:hypothetical protein
MMDLPDREPHCPGRHQPCVSPVKDRQSATAFSAIFPQVLSREIALYDLGDAQSVLPGLSVYLGLLHVGQ